MLSPADLPSPVHLLYRSLAASFRCLQIAGECRRDCGWGNYIAGECKYGDYGCNSCNCGMDSFSTIGPCNGRGHNGPNCATCDSALTREMGAVTQFRDRAYTGNIGSSWTQYNYWGITGYYSMWRWVQRVAALDGTL